MCYGRSVEDGFLPVYSVDTEDEAYQLLRNTCRFDLSGDFVSEELEEEQTIERLFAFGVHLHEVHQGLLAAAKKRPAKTRRK